MSTAVGPWTQLCSVAGGFLLGGNDFLSPCLCPLATQAHPPRPGSRAFPPSSSLAWGQSWPRRPQPTALLSGLVLRTCNVNVISPPPDRTLSFLLAGHGLCESTGITNVQSRQGVCFLRISGFYISAKSYTWVILHLYIRQLNFISLARSDGQEVDPGIRVERIVGLLLASAGKSEAVESGVHPAERTGQQP